MWLIGIVAGMTGIQLGHGVKVNRRQMPAKITLRKRYTHKGGHRLEQGGIPVWLTVFLAGLA